MKQHILAALRQVFGQWENLLDSLGLRQSSRYAVGQNAPEWLDGYSMADARIGSYQHHKEHLEELREHRQEMV